MISEPASVHLRYILEQHSEKVFKPKSTVLFRRGDKACGMFVVFSGRVRLDLGVDALLARSYGAGALVGLPSTITPRLQLDGDGNGGCGTWFRESRWVGGSATRAYRPLSSIARDVGREGRRKS